MVSIKKKRMCLYNLFLNWFFLDSWNTSFLFFILFKRMMVYKHKQFLFKDSFLYETSINCLCSYAHSKGICDIVFRFKGNFEQFGKFKVIVEIKH